MKAAVHGLYSMGTPGELHVCVLWWHRVVVLYVTHEHCGRRRRDRINDDASRAGSSHQWHCKHNSGVTEIQHRRVCHNQTRAICQFGSFSLVWPLFLVWPSHEDDVLKLGGQ